MTLEAHPRRRDTLVTAAYALDLPSAPQGGRHRPIAYYLPSLASIAQMGAGMVVYTLPRHAPLVAAHLASVGAEADVIGRPIEAAPRHDQVQAIRLRQRLHLTPAHDRCHVLCHAKLAWVSEQAAANPFGSERFYWIDAGLAYPGLVPRRYLVDFSRDRCPLFTPAVLDGLAADAAALAVIGQRPLEGPSMHGIALEEHDPWIGRGGHPIKAQVVGGLFGGDRAAVRALHEEYDEVLAAMLGADRLGTEENVLTVLYHRDPTRARLHAFTTWYHEDHDVRRPGPDDFPFYRVLESLAEAGRAARPAETPAPRPYADRLLDEALHGLGGARGRDVFVVNIGALDGSTFDGTAGYVRAYGWRGLFVEPVPELFERLVACYRGFDGMSFENAAIAEHDGETTMFRVPPAVVDAGVVHHAFIGMSTLVPPRNGMASEHDRPVVERYAERVRVPCLTVPTLLAKHAVERIDVLHIDVEGYDWMVLQQFDLARYRPTVVRIERSSLSPAEVSEARWFMRGAGLEVVDFYDELVGVRPGWAL